MCAYSSFFLQAKSCLHVYTHPAFALFYIVDQLMNFLCFIHFIFLSNCVVFNSALTLIRLRILKKLSLCFRYTRSIFVHMNKLLLLLVEEEEEEVVVVVVVVVVEVVVVVVVVVAVVVVVVDVVVVQVVVVVVVVVVVAALVVIVVVVIIVVAVVVAVVLSN